MGENLTKSKHLKEQAIMSMKLWPMFSKMTPAKVYDEENVTNRANIPSRYRKKTYKKKTVADFVVRRVLNKIRLARKMTSIHSLLELPKGRSRRSKHDDITASIIDLSAFVS